VQLLRTAYRVLVGCWITMRRTRPCHLKDAHPLQPALVVDHRRPPGWIPDELDDAAPKTGHILKRASDFLLDVATHRACRRGHRQTNLRRGSVDVQMVNEAEVDDIDAELRIDDPIEPLDDGAAHRDGSHGGGGRCILVRYHGGSLRTVLLCPIGSGLPARVTALRLGRARFPVPSRDTENRKIHRRARL